MHKAIHWLNHYPADSVIGFPNTYPLDSDLSGERSARDYILVGERLYFLAASRLAFAGSNGKKTSGTLCGERPNNVCKGFSGLMAGRRRSSKTR